MKSFQQFTEAKDIFGFDRERQVLANKPVSEKPINPISTEVVL